MDSYDNEMLLMLDDDLFLIEPEEVKERSESDA